jgi:CheY-like chemotaxis protein
MIRADRETCSILIVENIDDLRAGLAKELNALGHSVTVAGERSEALAIGDQTEFDLLVSDLVKQ